jgi:hypothetical protein
MKITSRSCSFAQKFWDKNEGSKRDLNWALNILLENSGNIPIESSLIFTIWSFELKVMAKRMIGS